jgi:hypothetical protein
MLTKTARSDVEEPPVLPRVQSFGYGPVRRESALIALILVQKEVHFADRGSYQTTACVKTGMFRAFRYN